MMIYGADRLLRKFKERKGTFNLYNDTCQVEFQKGNILRISVPKPFSFRAGQYAELKIPALSKVQWHPFTIASAPHEPEMVFFVKALGDWTRRLHELVKYSSSVRPSPSESILEARIRGPYGSCSEHVGQHDQIVLIGGGVGSTPFCSISKDAFHRIKEQNKAQVLAYALEGPDDIRPAKLHEEDYRDTAISNSNMSFSNDSILQDIPFEDAGKTINFKKTRTKSLGRRNASMKSLWALRDTAKAHGRGKLGTELLNTLKTVSVNLFLMWTLLVRLAYLIIFVAFYRLSVTSEEVRAYRAFVGGILDLALSMAFALPICMSILAECLLWKADVLDVFLLIPLSLVPVFIDALGFLGIGGGFGSLLNQRLLIIFPLLLVAFLIRYFRVLGSKVLLVQRYSNSYTTTRSVDFVWTSPTRDDDSWLVEELWPICSSNIIRLHRFITRETCKPGTRPETVWNSVTGQYFITHYGRPNFDELFTNLTQNVRPGSTVGIFFCGPPKMSARVRASAMAAMIDQRTTEEVHPKVEDLEKGETRTADLHKTQLHRRCVPKRSNEGWWQEANARFVFREEKF